jgi:hypothetical protein
MMLLTPSATMGGISTPISWIPSPISFKRSMVWPNWNEKVEAPDTESCVKSTVMGLGFMPKVNVALTSICVRGAVAGIPTPVS